MRPRLSPGIKHSIPAPCRILLIKSAVVGFCTSRTVTNAAGLDINNRSCIGGFDQFGITGKVTVGYFGCRRTPCGLALCQLLRCDQQLETPGWNVNLDEV